MNDFTRDLYDKLQEELQPVAVEELSTLQKAYLAIEIIQKTLLQLREFITQYKFENTQEEILFFKAIEPKFHSELIYNVKLYQIERRKPVGGKIILEKFFQKELKSLYFFFSENEDFYKYYRAGSSFLDEMYFTRNSISSDFSIEEYTCILDTQFCTTQGYKIAKILAYEKLQKYLSNSLEQLSSTTLSTFPYQGKFKWTGTKVALTEYLYGLVYSGMINNGQVQVKELAELLQFIFDIDLGNYYRTRQEMYTRKKTAQFLELMLKRYQEGMDEADERYRS